jgi:hypothetical protein
MTEALSRPIRFQPVPASHCRSPSFRSPGPAKRRQPQAGTRHRKPQRLGSAFARETAAAFIDGRRGGGNNGPVRRRFDRGRARPRRWILRDLRVRLRPLGWSARVVDGLPRRDAHALAAHEPGFSAKFQIRPVVDDAVAIVIGAVT